MKSVGSLGSIWWVVIHGALIIELCPTVDLWLSMDIFNLTPVLEFSKKRYQETLDIHWIYFWIGWTRRT